MTDIRTEISMPPRPDNRPPPKAVAQAPEGENMRLPTSADKITMHIARQGETRYIKPFEDLLGKRVRGQQEGAIDEDAIDQMHQTLEAKLLYQKVDRQVVPQLEEVLIELKKLGIATDLTVSPELSVLAYAVRADQWGQSPKLEWTHTEGAKSADQNPVKNRIRVINGQVKIQTINTGLSTEALQQKLNLLLQSVDPQGAANSGVFADKLLADNTKLREWVLQQAVSRGIIKDRAQLNPDFIDIAHAKLDRRLVEGKDMQQASHGVEIWKTAEGRRFIVKRAPIHTLQAEVVENRLMRSMGIPVPETTIQEVDGEKVLVVGFLEAYTEEVDPFVLSEAYHDSPILKEGLLVDIWHNQYNRRPHNVMMKGDKVAFIDHGGALYARATGGVKEFPAELTTQNLWDIVRTIPDADPNGDVPVNEAYAQVLTVEGGRDSGQIVVKDKGLISQQVERLRRVGDGEIREAVAAAEYPQDKDGSIAQVQLYLEMIKAQQQKLATKVADDPTAKGNAKYARDVEWTSGAQRQFEALQQKLQDGEVDSLSDFVAQTLISRRDSIVRYFTREFS